MKISEAHEQLLNGHISKPDYIQTMYEAHHSILFDYANYIKNTNISAIEITDDNIVMTSRNNGVKMICPLGDHRVAPIEILNFGDYEPDYSSLIMRLISPKDCVIDIGANMGWYAINIGKIFPLSQIFAFEPIPKTFSLLEKNIQLNASHNISALPFGLSDEQKDLVFYFYPEGSGNASSANLSERTNAELINCHVKRLDDFVMENQLRVDFIKCDVEGAELFAFRGAKETLLRNKPIVFTEMLRKWAAKFGYHPNDIINFFSGIGYQCFAVVDNKLVEFFTMNENTIETNFFFLHPEKHAEKLYSVT